MAEPGDLLQGAADEDVVEREVSRPHSDHAVFRLSDYVGGREEF